MGLRKIFRKITRPIQKLIPKEIKPFAPYIAAGMIGPAGLPALGLKQGMSRALLAGLTRGVVDDEADFRDVLRTGVTAALPNIIKGGSNMLAGKLDPKLAADIAGNIDEASSLEAATGIKAKAAALASKIGQSDSLAKLTSGSILNKPTSGAIITAGSMDEARKLIDQYEGGLEGPYDRKNDRGALFAIFQKAQWGTDDEINDMLDRYGYMGGGSVMPIQTGIAGALPMPNTRPGYDMGGDILDGIRNQMASATGDESDDISIELFGKPVKDLTPDEFRDLQDEIEKLRDKFRSEKPKENIMMASYGFDDAMAESFAAFQDARKKGLIPPTMEFDEYLEIMRDSKIQQQPNRVMAAEGGIMDLGGMEKDYRNDGGFVPIGEKERADDVPARLSLNEFVMTADAVRAAGGGSVNKGAKRMYDMMYSLEGKI